MVVCNLTHQSKAKAETSLVTLPASGGTINGLEDTLALERGHTGPAIDHPQQDVVYIFSTQGSLDYRAATVAAGIFQQITNQTAEHAWVPLNAYRFAGNLGGTAGPFLGEQSQQIHHLALLQPIEGIESTGQQQLTDELVQLLDILEQANLKIRPWGMAHQLDTHAYPGQR